jgi:hypothetical protein
VNRHFISPVRALAVDKLFSIGLAVGGFTNLHQSDCTGQNFRYKAAPC